MESALSTLCYIRNNDKYLMLHRISKDHDVNKDKWIGVGGHFLPGESPEECLLREVKEETGWTLDGWQFHGIVTFVLQSGNEEESQSESGLTEYMFLFTTEEVNGGIPEKLPECDEGVLEWVSISDVMNLNLWEGDKIFFRLIEEKAPFFSLKLVYNPDGVLLQAVLDGKELPRS